MAIDPDRVALGLLAGGEGKRLGGTAKGLLKLAGRPMAQWALSAVEGRVGPRALSVHAEDPQWTPLGLPQVIDWPGPRMGPIAAIAALLEWADGQGAKRLLTLPADTPFVRPEAIDRLSAALDGTFGNRDPAELPVALPVFKKRRHHALALWPVGGRAAAVAARACREGGASLKSVFEETGVLLVDCDDLGPEDPFLNVNTPNDLAKARTRATTQVARALVPDSRKL
jgi:molybdopterin-guanine dinucleotide biosynthesis protein A